MSMRPTPEQEIEDLKAKIKKLETELSDAHDGTQLIEGYQQCIDDLRNVARGVIEVTWASGPAEALQFLLHRLEEKDIPVTSPMGVPLDWLSRWKVELA